MGTPLDHDAINELPPEMPGGLTFHLPMELAALRDAGASAEEIARRGAVRLTEAWTAGLVDPPLYRWAVTRYRESAAAMLADDREGARDALRDIEPLAEGLAGAAFHGLIRLGYAAWHRDEMEIARGLAYLRTRRQVLAAPARMGEERAGAPSVRADLPGPDERDGVTVFDLLNLVAGTGACTGPSSPRAATPRALALAAVALVQRNPSSFVAVHALTGFHALCELHLLATGTPPSGAPSGEPTYETDDHRMAAWWSAYAIAAQACTLAVESGPPEALAAYDEAYGRVTDVNSLVAASVASEETHDVKLAVALRRLVAFGVLTDDEACAAGTARLAAGQLD